MTIGLIDADLMWQKHANGRRYGNTKADIFPNLALMKLSAWHKRQGDDVEMYFDLRHYDRVYISKVFSTTPESRVVINADEVIRGGSGYNIQLIDGREVWKPCTGNLPDEVWQPRQQACHAAALVINDEERDVVRAVVKG